VQVDWVRRRKRDVILIWTSESSSFGDGQETRGRRATKETALQMTIGAGNVKMKRVAVREREPERGGNLVRRGTTVLAVWILVRQKTQGRAHKGGRKIRNVYTLGFNENLDM
jgi:hypothetical protein